MAIVSNCYADQVASTKFKGLNLNTNSVLIDASEAQDLLNVDVQPSGSSVRKRFGYGVYKALTSGLPVKGGYHLFDSTGNDVQLFGTGTTFYAVVADGTPTVLVSSATTGSTWDCVDTQGSAYCVDSNRDVYLKTNGTTKAWGTAPLGTMVEATPDRVVVAGVSGSPNTLFVSQSNTFTNYTVGPLPTDPFTEVIASPGSKLTHIRWGCGKLLWWKDQSFGYFDFDDQFAAQVKTVDSSIGTLDNTSAIDPGGRVWFRGQDGHTWMYDCSILTKQSIDITPDVQITGRRVANSWIQTTQADFQAGASSPTPNLSFTISPNDVTVSSWTKSETSSAGGWASGSVSNMFVGASSITLNTNNSGNITNPDFESSFSGNWFTNGPFSWVQTTGLFSLSCGSILPQTGSNFSRMSSTTFGTLYFELVDLSSGILSQTTVTQNQDCTWRSTTISQNIGGKRFKVRLHFNSASGDSYLITSDSYIFGGPMTFFYNSAQNGGGFPVVAFDNITNGSSTITTGNFTSQVFDTGLSSPTFQATAFSYVAGSTPTFGVSVSSSATGTWSLILSTSGTNAVGKRYAFYSSTITIGSSDTSIGGITGVTLLARSTGTYISAVKNAPNIAGWNTFSANTQLNDGTESFFIRADTNVIVVNQSTPSWTSLSNGALVTIATGTYIQIRDDFFMTAATQTPTLNDFTLNWFEGVASDQAYLQYFDNAIWESVAFGAGQAVNNYIFKYDLINEGWTLYNFGAGGLWIQSNTLYFGDTVSGNVFNYGTVKSDNGAAINAFWKSKDYTGSDPFLMSSLTNIDTFAKKDAGSTLTSAYTLDTSTTATSYSINLSSTTSTIIQSRKLLPAGRNGYTFNIKYSDTSASSQWELFGYRIGFTVNPYRSAN